RPRSVYSDLTRVSFVGETVPAKYNEIFRIVAAARDAAIRCVQEAYAVDRPQHRPGSPRQRRAHGQSGNPRGATGPATDLLLGRTGDLSRGIRHQERGERVCRWQRQGPRHRRTPDGGLADPQELRGIGTPTDRKLPGQDSNLEKQDQNLL